MVFVLLSLQQVNEHSLVLIVIFPFIADALIKDDDVRHPLIYHDGLIQSVDKLIAFISLKAVPSKFDEVISFKRQD
jgi:hypothetical protein